MDEGRFTCVKGTNSKICLEMGFPMALVVKTLPANTGDMRDMGSIPGLGGTPGGGHGNPFLVFLKRWLL